MDLRPLRQLLARSAERVSRTGGNSVVLFAFDRSTVKEVELYLLSDAIRLRY